MILRKLVLTSILLLTSIIGGIYLNAALIDFYKKGPIVLKPDPDYAKLDYESLFYDSGKHIAVAEDGAVFVSNGAQNNISKFKNSKLVKVFGRSGLGPGDTYHPSTISILDNKFLVIQEDVDIRMISLFDLDGNFVKKIKTKYLVLNVIALENNKIAILTSNTIFQQKHSKTQYRVIIKNISTNHEIIAATFNEKPKQILDEKKIYMKFGSHDGEFFLFKIGGGNLLVGHSFSSEISIYSPEGKKINSFNVNYKQKKFSDEMKDECFKTLKENFNRYPQLKEITKKANWDNSFPELVPYYRNISVDSDNNILVFEHTGFEIFDEIKFHIYNITGKFLGEELLRFGQFKPKYKFQLFFLNGFLYSLLERKDTDDILLNFVKIKIN